MADYCVYWNDFREQYHVTKTDKATKYATTILSTGLTYDEADEIRRNANREYVKHIYLKDKEVGSVVQWDKKKMG